MFYIITFPICVQAFFLFSWYGLLNWNAILFKFFSISRVCRFKSDEERVPVHRIVDEIFPSLLNIFNKLVQIANPPVDVADYIKLICKIFWSSIYVRLCMNGGFFFVNFYLIRQFDSLELNLKCLLTSCYCKQEETPLQYLPQIRVFFFFFWEDGT